MNKQISFNVSLAAIAGVVVVLAVIFLAASRPARPEELKAVLGCQLQVCYDETRVGVVVAMPGPAVPTSGELAAVDAYLQSVRPVTAQVITLAASLYPVNCTLHLNPSTASTQAGNASTSAGAASASAASAISAPGTSATSSTSLAIGLGAQSLTIQTGKSIVVGMFVTIAK